VYIDAHFPLIRLGRLMVATPMQMSLDRKTVLSNLMQSSGDEIVPDLKFFVRISPRLNSCNISKINFCAVGMAFSSCPLSTIDSLSLRPLNPTALDS
jgi:hypothetical protein